MSGAVSQAGVPVTGFEHLSSDYTKEDYLLDAQHTQDVEQLSGDLLGVS